jgi:dihydrodipicolinate synthase/N-acetylneuraminate lyase
MNPWQSRERLSRILALKPGAVQVILPDWFIPSQPESINFLTGMAGIAGEIGLVLYNPPHAKRVLSPADLLHLHNKVPQVVGIKVAEGNETWYEEMKPLAREISVFVPGHRIASAFRKGVGHGAYSNMACLNPKAAQIWWDTLHSDPDSALELEGRVLDFLDRYIHPFIQQQGYSNQAVDKFMAVLGDWTKIASRLRWPYRSIPEKEAIGLRPLARNMIPEFFIKI